MWKTWLFISFFAFLSCGCICMHGIPQLKPPHSHARAFVSVPARQTFILQSFFQNNGMRKGCYLSNITQGRGCFVYRFFMLDRSLFLKCNVNCSNFIGIGRPKICFYPISAAHTFRGIPVPCWTKSVITWALSPRFGYTSSQVSLLFAGLTVTFTFIIGLKQVWKLLKQEEAACNWRGVFCDCVKCESPSRRCDQLYATYAMPGKMWESQFAAFIQLHNVSRSTAMLQK